MGRAIASGRAFYCFARAALTVPGFVRCVVAWESTAWQRELLASVAKTAKIRSDAAAPALVARLGDQDLRAEIRACSPDTADWSDSELAERVRQEIAAVEVVSGFATEGMPGRMTLDEAMEGPSFFESNWQVAVRRGLNLSSFPWLGMRDDVETQLYGFKPFSRRGLPRDMEQASERPPYFMANLYRVDAGSPLYGDATVVLRTSFAAETSVISAVDTGGWTAMCNSSQHWLPPSYRASCSEFVPHGAQGTLQYSDHLLVMNTGYWNVSLGRLLCRLLAPWGQVPIVGSDLIHYFEAMPAARISYPSSIKFVIGSFPSLFGTAIGARLRTWCVRNKWILVWSLGLNLGRYPANFFTAVNLTQPFSSNARLVDPEVLVQSSASFAPSAVGRDAAERAFRAAWGQATLMRRNAKIANRTVSNSTWGSMWAHVEARMPQEYHLEPLRAGVCPDADRCIGVNRRGVCVCYHAADSADLIV